MLENIDCFYNILLITATNVAYTVKFEYMIEAREGNQYSASKEEGM